MEVLQRNISQNNTFTTPSTGVNITVDLSLNSAYNYIVLIYRGNGTNVYNSLATLGTTSGVNNISETFSSTYASHYVRIRLVGTGSYSPPREAYVNNLDVTTSTLVTTETITVHQLDIDAVYSATACTGVVSGKDYKFGFNGMEKDNEIQGQGNAYDFGARIYDSRLGRWLSMDPLQTKYPNLSPYNFVGNMPIIAIDPDGKDIIIINSTLSFKKAKKLLLQTPEGKEIWNKYAKSKEVDIYISMANFQTGSIEIANTAFDISGTSMIKNNKISVPKEGFKNFANLEGYDVSKSKGKKIGLIVFNSNPIDGNFADTKKAKEAHAESSGSEFVNDYDNAESIFHELKAHIDLARSGGAVAEHDAYGNTHNGVMKENFGAKAGSPADKIKNSLEKIRQVELKKIIQFKPEVPTPKSTN